MRNTRLLILVCIFILTAVLGASAGQVPDYFHLLLADGSPLPYHTELVGTSTEGGLTAEWTVTDFSAEIRITGTHNVEGYPHFDLAWIDTEDVLPLSVTFTTAGVGAYSFEPYHWPVGGTAYDYSLSQYNLTENSEFGHYFPEAESFKIMVIFDNAGDEYDLTVNMDWGPGVPTEFTTWGQIKSVYR